MHTQGVTKAFTEGPPAIVHVENVVRCNEYVKQLGILTPGNAARSLQETPERLQLPADSTDAGVAYGAVNGDATQIGAPPKFEIELRDAILFSVSLKEAGVEKARAEAKVRPGT